MDDKSSPIYFEKNSITNISDDKSDKCIIYRLTVI